MGAENMVGLSEAGYEGSEVAEAGRGHLPAGGDVLIDPTGIVSLHHVGAGPADRPAIETIMNKIHPV
jgi:hypothetical protein